MSIECMLCAEQAEFIGVGECNHEPICYRCIYKMRVISKNNQCPICKAGLKNIILMKQVATFQSHTKGLLGDKNFSDILHTSEQCRIAFERLTEYKCFVKSNGHPCKTQKTYTSINFLKKHLKEDHNRYLCQLCIQKKTCVLEQHKLYTYKALTKHQQRGDTDEFGNITFMHPFCNFCSKYFFDQDQFRRHINNEHFTCHVCGDQEKYRYYKNYDSLEKHYKISHYICNDENCLAKKFIAFANVEQLKFHKIQFHEHNLNRKINGRQLCGFRYEGFNPNDEVIEIKDKEGVNMQDQFLNLKKCKNKALVEADKQIDGLLDPRIFFECKLDDEQLFESAFVVKHVQNDQQRPQTQQQKKKKYVQKNEADEKREKQRDVLSKENKVFYLEDLNLIQTFHLPRISSEQFETKLKSILHSDEIVKFTALTKRLMKKQIKQPEFVEQFIEIVSSVSRKNAFLIFPHYLRTVMNQDLKDELDKAFVMQLKKVPSKNQNILTTSKNYSDLFQIFLKEIQMNIEERIKRQTLSIKKPIKRCKQRLFQIMGVVRRLKIQQMAKFKFATNFGILKDTVDHVVNQIYKKKINQIQQKLFKIQNDQTLDLYIFVKFCLNTIKHTKDMHTEKNKIHENILQDFLFDKPYLEEKYGLKKSELKSLQEKVQFEKYEEQKKIKKTLKEIQKKNLKQGFQVKTDFNLVDKGDFPDLVVPSKNQQKKQEKFKEVMRDVKEKPATYQKKINEMFPSLGQQSPARKQEESSPSLKAKQPVKVEKAWWQKINETKKIEIEQQQEKVRIKKGKRQKWVSVKGLF